ncbi:MAG: hypothetical protein AAGF12_26050, partial [Myxococcota bacterium]
MRLVVFALSGLWLIACSDDDPVAPENPDASVMDAEPDARSFVCPTPDLRFSQPGIGILEGAAREVELQLKNTDYCTDLAISLSSMDEGIATIASEVVMPQGLSRVTTTVTAGALGTTTITATFTTPDNMTRTATLEVGVTDATVPTCSGDANGMVNPGGSVEVTTGSLAGTTVRLQEGAATTANYLVDPFMVEIGCAADQVPEGFRALGPAVSFGPAALRFSRDIPFAIPLRLSLMPATAHRGHIEVSYTGPGAATPRTIPVAVGNVTGSGDALLHFEAPRLGTYQAVVRETAGQPRERTFAYNGIVGVSMGGLGAGAVGFQNPERFDFVAPLGAAWDWGYLLDYIYTYHLGGFCTEAERQANPAACGAASIDRVPPARFAHEHVQDFEHWWYDDDQRGHGGTFDRAEYIRIFQDLARMFGNLNTDAAETEDMPNITPPGVPDSDRTRSNAERCAEPVVIPPFNAEAPAGTGFFDDEFNPEGTYSAITFCDGSDARPNGVRDVGVWDPMGDNRNPIEAVVAVDINDNGIRDPGEPVIRNMREPFEDCGLDRLCNEDEPGFDAVTNPDPAGDDYDYQYNPTGLEGNFLRDGDRCDVAGGEVFTDSGMDGVMGTAQLSEGGFDRGE